jgi:DedD protein
LNLLLKQRLVGAIVLISLAVIFLPMLLDGTNGSGSSRLVDRMPATPVYQFETLEIPLDLPQSEPREPTEPKAEAHNSEPEKPAVIVKPTAPAAPVAPPAAVKKKAAPRQKADDDGWVVQMGSFSSADNAHALRDKLRKHAFKAYVESIKSGGATSYRVRVGPEVSREKADALKERISKKLKLDSIVMPHSP